MILKSFVVMIMKCLKMIEVKMKDETVWLSQKQLAELFDCSVDNIALHLKNVYIGRELDEKRTSEESSVVQNEGKRESRS